MVQYHKLASLLRYVGEIARCRFFRTDRLLWTVELTVCLHMKSPPRIILIYLTLILLLGFTAKVYSVITIYVHTCSVSWQQAISLLRPAQKHVSYLFI